MKVTNLRSYSVIALFVSGALALACGSDKGGSDGSGGSNGDGGGKGDGGSSNGNGGSGNSNGGSNNGGSTGSDTPAPGQLCQRVAEIQCAGEAACCSSPGRDVAACQTAQKMVCGTTLSLDSVAMDPITGFDMTKSNAAFAKFDELAKNCDTSIASFGISLDGFRGIAAGKVDPGAICNPDKTATSRVAATAAALVSCKDPANTACLPAPTGMDWKCAARADAGGKCFTDANCKDGLYCDNPNLSLSGSTCKQRKGSGMDCMTATECTSLACTGGKCADQTKDTAYCLTKM